MIPERGPQTVFKQFLCGAIKNARNANKCKIANIANMQKCKQYQSVKMQIAKLKGLKIILKFSW